MYHIQFTDSDDSLVTGCASLLDAINTLNLYQPLWPSRRLRIVKRRR